MAVTFNNASQPLPGWRGRALIVDEAPGGQRALAAIVEGLGWEAICVSGGTEAISMAALTAFDAIVMEVQMPGIDGLDTARVIRALGGWSRDAAIVALSAHMGAEMRARARDAGIDICLAKPVRPAEIADALRSAMLSRAAPAISLRA